MRKMIWDLIESNQLSMELRRLGKKPVGRKTFGRIIFFSPNRLHPLSITLAVDKSDMTS